MATKTPFLGAHYGAYYHRDLPREDEELTHVGPGTPCGEYLRRSWHPILIATELQDLPMAVRIMGEDLVAFRDKKGRVGLLELHCTHRGTSLEFAQIEDEGIRCCYHGWLFGTDGAILDTPGEPAESTFKDRLCQGAYPTLEYRGLIFAYMGPPDRVPDFPIYDTFNVPGYDRWVWTRDNWACNWLQVKDNCMDPAHTAFLHTIQLGVVQRHFSEAVKEFGVLDWMETPIGMVYIHCRRIGDNIWIRMNDFICPTIHQVPEVDEDGTQEHGFSPATKTDWLIPIDDTHCTTITLKHYKEGETPPDQNFFGQDGDRPYEQRQRVPGDWDAQVSQRPIAVHGLERLGATDRGILMLRRMVRDGIRAVQDGQDPKGLARDQGKVVSTYANNTVVRVPAAPTPEEDRRLLLETGRKIAQAYVNDPSSRTEILP